ncbi:5-hydroxytryptamine receptor 1F-like [Ascaphus truei]|uniref:5-hydroxytryptamine receptor 1F-like n=1 Tax=Ascaphus truei TaxID=8439 RepID=UPI003F5A1E07
MSFIPGNLLVIIIIAATKHFHSITSIFLLNLAVSDFLVGVGVMPLVATSVIYNRWINQQYLCLYMGYAFVVYCTSSVLTLAAIALDRYRAIIDCFQYNTQSTVKRAIGTVIWIWTQATFSGVPPFVGWGHFEYLPATFSCSVNWAHSPSYTGFVMACSFLLPTFAMVFCYIRIVKVARDHARRIHNIECQLQKNMKPIPSFLGPDSNVSVKMDTNNAEDIPPDPNTDDSQSSIDTSHLPSPASSHSRKQDIFAMYNTPGREHNGTCRLFLVILIYICCWVPYIIVSILQSVTARNTTWKLPLQIQTLAAWLALLNSAINPLLYALLSKRFRKALSNLKQKTLFKINVLLEDVPSMGTTEKATSNTRRVHLLRPHPHANPFEKRLRLGSFSMFSIASFAETGPEEESGDYIPVRLSGLTPAGLRRPQTTERSSALNQDSLLLRPQCLVKQYLEVPHLPCEPLSPCQPRGENDGDSVFIFGNITVKVNESGSACRVDH